MDYEADLRRISRCLLDIASMLESVEDPAERVRRTLTLTQELVPYVRCALLTSTPSDELTLVAVPELHVADHQRLLATLERSLRLIGDEDATGRSFDGTHHLTVPIIGLDRVIGLLRVEPPEQIAYDAQHLRLLSVVGAQLGAYLTLVRLREESELQARQLAAVNEFQQRLVGVVSHDLRSPLSVIIMMASRLLDEAKDPAQARVIERALRSAERASRIINDLLDVTSSRVTGGMAVAKRRTDLRVLLQEVVEDARVAHPGRKIEQLEVGTAQSPHGEWDPDRLAQAVTNLINNAFQHGQPGTPVRVRLSFEKDEVSIAIQNRGPVVANELLPSLFDPFTQGGAARHRAVGGGLGLGLYIVDQIARAHGGRVEARSTAAEGTTFTLTLPRSSAEQRRSTPWGLPTVSGGARLPSEPPPGSEPQPIVMVVDDDPLVTEGLTEILKRRGYRVATASNGEKALTALRGGLRPKLILLDLLMPVMDGETFAKSCREDPALSSIPIVIISAFTAEAVKLAQAVATEYLPKPFHVGKLLDTLKRIPG